MDGGWDRAGCGCPQRSIGHEWTGACEEDAGQAGERRVGIEERSGEYVLPFSPELGDSDMVAQRMTMRRED